MLQIRLLGQFDIRLDGKRVMIPTRTAQSLFAYLVLTAGTPHRREKLAGTFWPNTTKPAPGIMEDSQSLLCTTIQHRRVPDR